MSKDVNQVDEKNNRITMLQLLAQANAWFQTSLLNKFKASGWDTLGNADLNLLANLNCGSTYSSELARRMGVSRQAINKLLKNLVEASLVTLETDPQKGNTKVIVITETGRELIMQAISELDQMEALLQQRIGKTKATALRKALEADWGEPSS
ncbi:MarR family winged helix-turn-helix transcriptional regulator [Rubellicoccus peritrichatus]|uniref:MarR family transcriptional regulator n=1 Tax=Rubellicoccus peritrichatus TaxID=3080537 RepID=A0AAQ3LDD2_9BACT|nr:MarR family transcriptional regulator [Puniceicoccus sp. CR14]WOO41800.1 MarR family transcriptional regulator [Puniceicoccus sp. CR14]